MQQPTRFLNTMTCDEIISFQFDTGMDALACHAGYSVRR
jgi:hypothetical protein